MKFKILILLPLLLLASGLSHASTDKDSLLVRSIIEDSTFFISPSMDYIFEQSDVLTEGMIMNPALDSVQFMIDKARAVFEKIRNTGNFIKNIDEHSKFELPVGLPKLVDGIDYELAIDAIRLKPTHAELDVFLKFTVPSNGQELYFMGKGIKYTKKGGIVGDATLVLLGDYGINMSGNKAQVLLKANDTYATIDCDGFKELGIGADVKFSRDLIVPERVDGTVDPQGNVIASFKTVLTGWNDLIVQLSLPAFQMRGLPGISFNVVDAVFDFSDLRNATNVQFPKDYNSTQMLPDNQNLWRGFYLRDLTIKLPKEFKQRGSSERIVFNAHNVIIDNMGLTGTFSGTNLIQLQEGDLGGWDFSLTELHVEIQTNQLVEAGFSGEILIPISKEDTPFEYAALITTDGKYQFHVSPATDMEFDIFKAGKVTIHEASYLDIRVEDGTFLPKANLHGNMSIKASLSEGGQGVELANIEFENLQIQTTKPYLQIGNIGFGSEALQQAMAGFPVSIQDVATRTVNTTDVALDFKLKLNLVKESSGAFAADAGLSIIGTIKNQGDRQRYEYKEIQVHEIGVDINGGAYKIQGRLVFYRNDKTYGDGFNGMVNAEFKPGIKVRAGAIFGSVGGERYWYADALVSFDSGIPIFTGVAVYGFGGGIFYGMKIDKYGEGSNLGKTASGVTYVPDSRSGIGLKAMITLGSSPSPQAFNAEVFFEIAFFKGGGVRYIAFGGNGTLITPGLDKKVEKLASNAEKMASVVGNSNAPEGNMQGGDTHSLDAIFGPASEINAALAARVFIEYDFENTTLHGNFEVFINVAGGVIRGVGKNNRAGWAVLHFAPHEWYIYVGTPDDRIGISVGVGSVRAEATSYFMVGTKILGSPPPPPEVSRILGGVDLDYMKDLNAIGTGAGFAFGAALSISTGDLTFLMFYARLDAGAGFDIMIKDYGDTRCEGQSDRIGINGWYANGQAYAYFEGSIGIRIKVFGFSKKIPILSIGAAAVLQAKLPNPFWMRGVVGGYFSVLGGAVRGECKFQVTIGNECKIIRDANAVLDDIKIIADLTPANKETHVNVFTSPQALFSLPVEKTFEIYDEVTRTKRLFKVHLDYFKVMHKNKELVGALVWNDTKDVAAFESYEILPSEEEISLVAQVSFKENKNGNWLPVLENGKPFTERMEQTFVTGVAPDYIPHENIAYSYPMLSQLNFYRNESSKGYIKLKKAMPDLFNPGNEWRQEGRFTTGETAVSFDFTYDYGNNLVSYTIPGNLTSNTMYTLELINVPVQQSSSVDRNVTEVSRQVSVDGTTSGVEIASKKAEGTIANLQEKSIYTSYLRSSPYGTFKEKIVSFNYTTGWTAMLAPGVHQLVLTLNSSEHFEKFELDKEVGRPNSLIRLVADTQNTWYRDLVYPLVYEGYPLDGMLNLKRNRGTLTIPPVNAVFLRQNNGGEFILRDDYIFSGRSIPWADKSALAYDLPYEMALDYSDIRSYGSNLLLTTDHERLNKLLTTPFPVLRTGTYKVKLQYVLPGINEVTSEETISINYTGEYQGSR